MFPSIETLKATLPKHNLVLSAADEVVTDKPKPTGIDLYSRFALAGALGCALTHGALTPVDVVKTRIQLSPEIYNRGMIGGFKQVIQSEGAGALLTGFGPTAAGYFVQGAFKFGGYEFFKKQLIELVGVENAPTYRTLIFVGASGLAEFFADIALCPLEATRIRLVSNPQFASGLVPGFLRIVREDGVLRGLYAGFGPILLKQIPYTITKFVVYERASEAIYSMLPPKENLSSGTVTSVNLGSGLISGIAAAIVSQPADTLLSKINKQKNAEGSITSRLVQLSKELGVRGLFLGLGARVVMVGALTAGQFGIYGDIKRMLNATGGYDIAKASK